MEKITADDIHNWSAPYVVNQWRHAQLTQEQRDWLMSAEIRHHRHGVDAQELADEFNERMWP